MSSTHHSPLPSNPTRWSSSYYDSLYQLERTWATRMVEEYRPFVIYGGRGVGKSPVLEWIRDELLVKGKGYLAFDEATEANNAAESMTYLFIAGTGPRSETSSVDRLADAARAKPRPTAVLIDDIDQILGQTKENPSETARAIKKLLGDLRQFVPVEDDRNLLILTATEEIHEPHFDDPELRQEEELWSRLFTRIERKQLNPWSAPGWRDDLADWIQTELTSDGASEGSPLPATVRTELARIAPGLIVALGGGHPNVTGQLLDILEDFWTKDDTLRDPLELRIGQLCEQTTGQEPTLSNLLTRYLEDRLVRSPRGLRALRRGIQRLQEEHESTGDATAFSELVGIARQRDRGASAPKDFHIRHQLTAGGFVYEDPDSLRFVVPGTVLQGEVLRYQTEDGPTTVEDEEEHPPLVLSPSPKQPRDEGVLAVSRADGERVQVPLDGQNWKIVAALDQQRSQFLSVEELAHELGGQEAATRSALRRLREKLEEYGISGILDNQWGKGYRLVEPS